MKKVTKCHNCKKIIREHGSFTAVIEEPVKFGEYETGEKKKKVIKLCRTCTAEAGYKVKGINK